MITYFNTALGRNTASVQYPPDRLFHGHICFNRSTMYLNVRHTLLLCCRLHACAQVTEAVVKRMHADQEAISAYFSEYRRADRLEKSISMLESLRQLLSAKE